MKAAGWISRALVERGIAVLRFDFTGIGESEGELAGNGLSSNVDDLVAAADFLRRERAAPRLLIGHSLGGCAVLAAAGRIPEARAVSTIGTPSNSDELRRTILRLAPDLEARGEAEVHLGGRPFRVDRALLDDLAEDHLKDVVGNLHRAFLIFHSPVDAIVGLQHARRLFDLAKHPKSFVSLDTADHLLSRERDARYCGEVLAARWASRFLENPLEGTIEPEVGHAGEVVVTGAPRGYAQEILAHGHRLIADEPADAGGTDRGPTPYDLLLGALGACTSMTLRMYADRKQLPLEGVRVRLRYSKVHAVDCARCETQVGKIDRIERDIEVMGPLAPEQRQRLLEMADRCPVHRTITSEIDIVTRLS